VTGIRRRALPATVLVVAVACLIASISVVAAWENSHGPDTVVGAFVPGTAPVRTLDQARTAADAFAARLGLHSGEVIQFDNGFYAELLDPAGAGATEVLIDPANGTVGVEYGPAMMWNTIYGVYPRTGMHLYAAHPSTIAADQARQIAQTWLGDNRPGQQAGPAEAFPGYYTIDTTIGGTTSGMLSVNATSGQVWYHSWHGRFIASQDFP
jgi:hypothetical protein